MLKYHEAGMKFILKRLLVAVKSALLVDPEFSRKARWVSSKIDYQESSKHIKIHKREDANTEHMFQEFKKVCDHKENNPDYYKGEVKLGNNKKVKRYSLGMRQRLGIARAIMHKPELLILDEPTNGLDPVGIKEIRKLIKDLAEKKMIAIFMSSHILSEVQQLATTIGVIHAGKLLEEIDFKDLKSQGGR